MRFMMQDLWFVLTHVCVDSELAQSYSYEATVASATDDFEPLSTFAYSHVSKKFGLEAIVSQACQVYSTS